MEKEGRSKKQKCQSGFPTIISSTLVLKHPDLSQPGLFTRFLHWQSGLETAILPLSSGARAAPSFQLDPLLSWEPSIGSLRMAEKCSLSQFAQWTPAFQQDWEVCVREMLMAIRTQPEVSRGPLEVSFQCQSEPQSKPRFQPL